MGHPAENGRVVFPPQHRLRQRETDFPEARNRQLTWIVALAAVLLLAAGLRFFAVSLGPFHHDEGVNGFFETGLYRHGDYRYDPHNYHGPTLYFAALPSTLLLGLNENALRGVTAFFGLLTVWLATRLHPWIGRVGALTTALLLAVSPGMVYFSRYFIHEMLLIAATLGIVVAACRFRTTGTRATLLEGAFWAAWLVATKETASATLVVLILAALCQAAWCRLRGVPRRPWPRPRIADVAWALGLFTSVTALLYTSFFTHMRGIVDAVRALAFWSSTGVKAHVHPWSTYFKWLWKEEPALIVLGAAGMIVILSLRSRSSRSALVFWTLGMLAAYSIVPYKTPWLTLNIVLPLACCAGVGVDELAHRLGWLVMVPVVTLAASIALGQAIDLSFRRYDDETLPYVYAHTRRGFLELVRLIDERAAQAQGDQTKITVVATEHWPLPWYLRRFPRTPFTNDIASARDGELVVGNPSQDDELQRILGPQFERLGQFPLRPGAELVLYARRHSATP
jgi:uncharacterized protein (TIGR03663 family)